MLSRATAGVAAGGLLFALPGSKNAVKTAWEKLLEPELSHLVFELTRHGH
jgi:molybdopterin adenylyltransferase